MKKQKTLLTIFILLIVSAVFYWFQIRPSKIKHDCSWIAHHEDAVPERQAMTEEELREKGMLEDCDRYPNYADPQGSVVQSLEASRGRICRNNNQYKIEDYKNSKPAKPARDWYEASTDSEYKFCLRDKGL